MKYKYVKLDEFIQGLPANDLDDADLNEHEKVLLEGAVAMGIYEAEAAPKKAEKAKADPKHDEKPAS